MIIGSAWNNLFGFCLPQFSLLKNYTNFNHLLLLLPPFPDFILRKILHTKNPINISLKSLLPMLLFFCCTILIIIIVIMMRIPLLLLLSFSGFRIHLRISLEDYHFLLPHDLLLVTWVSLSLLYTLMHRVSYDPHHSSDLLLFMSRSLFLHHPHRPPPLLSPEELKEVPVGSKVWYTLIIMKMTMMYILVMMMIIKRFQSGALFTTSPLTFCT